MRCILEITSPVKLLIDFPMNTNDTTFDRHCTIWEHLSTYARKVFKLYFQTRFIKGAPPSSSNFSGWLKEAPPRCVKNNYNQANIVRALSACFPFSFFSLVVIVDNRKWNPIDAASPRHVNFCLPRDVNYPPSPSARSQLSR